MTRRKARLTYVVALLLLAALYAPSTARAEAQIVEPDFGNLFMCAQHAVAAEGRFQPPASLLRMARVIRTKGECFRGKGWLTSWDLAQQVMLEDQHNCIAYMSCSGYFLFDTISPEVREPIAQAVYQAMTEDPPVLMFHFDRGSQQQDVAHPELMAAWWFAPSACPNGFSYAGDLRFC